MEHRIIGRPSYSLLELKLKPGEEVPKPVLWFT